MAQLGYTPLIHYSSGTAAAIPIAGNLNLGELALNYNDGKLFYKNSSGTVTQFTSGVTGFQTSLSGLTPSTSTTGAVTLAGTLGAISGGTSFTTYAAGDTIYSSASNTLAKLPIGGVGQVLTVSAGLLPTWVTVTGTGTVTSVSATVPTFLSITGSPITSSGTLAIGLSGTALPVANGGTGQTSFTDGQLLIGNTTGNTLTKTTLTAGSGISITNGGGSISIAATNSGTVTSVSGTSPIASSGGTTPTISLSADYGDTLNPYASKTANYVLAAPSGVAGVPTFRAVVAADIPTLNQNTTGSAATLTTGRTIAITGDLSYTSSSFDGSANVTAAGTLATVNTNVGSFTNATLTVNGKGLITAASDGTAPVTSVTGTAPVVSSGGVTPAISMAAATTSVSGYLTSTDWNTFNSKGSGTVTAVSVASSNGFAGSSSGGATPALTLSTSITGVLKGNGTAISAATVGTDYSVGTSALTTGILKSTATTGALSIAVAGDFPTLNQNTTGTASIATNISGGSAGATFYNTAASTTTTLGIGTSYQIKAVNSTSSAPSWQGLSSLIDNALAASTQGQILYRGASSWVPLSPGTSGQALTSGGAAANPSWGTLNPSNGGTGVVNNSAMTVTGSGNFAYTRTLTAATNVTFPTTGTLATLAGTETFTNKTLTTPVLTNPTVTNYVETPYSANSSTAITLDLANGTVQIITLTGNATITMPTAVSGKSFIMFLRQDATGSRTVTWSVVTWASATPPTITATASRQDVYSFFSDGSKWYGVIASQNYIY